MTLLSEEEEQQEDQGQKKKEDKDKLPQELEQEIKDKKESLDEKVEEIKKSNLIEILQDENITEQDLIKKIRGLPYLTREDHKIIDDIDKSKLRLWLMKESQNDMFGIKSKKIKKVVSDDEVEYELDDEGKPILIKEYFFYSPLTNHQKKKVRNLEMVTNMSAASFNRKNVECLQMQIQRKEDTKEYWDAMEEREKLQKTYTSNLEALNRKVAEFRLGVKPSQFDHLVETDLMRYLQVAQYKESVANPQ